MRSSLYLEHILVACQAKKKISFFSKKFKNFIFFVHFAFGRAFNFCVHVINYGQIIMSKLIFEVSFMPRTYFNSVPSKIFFRKKIQKFHIFMHFTFGKASYFCVHVINFDLIIMKYKFIFEVILILRIYLSRMRSKKNWISKKKILY